MLEKSCWPHTTGFGVETSSRLFDTPPVANHWIKTWNSWQHTANVETATQVTDSEVKCYKFFRVPFFDVLPLWSSTLCRLWGKKYSGSLAGPSSHAKPKSNNSFKPRGSFGYVPGTVQNTSPAFKAYAFHKKFLFWATVYSQVAQTHVLTLSPFFLFCLHVNIQ